MTNASRQNHAPSPHAAHARSRNKVLPRVADVSRHIFAKRPRCRQCGSADLRATRTICKDGDAVHRYVTCKKCGERYVLVLD